MTDEYKKYADSNAFLNKVQYPSRGAIYDRNGKLLVFNQPAYDIAFVPREVHDLDTLDFCRSLGISLEQFHERMADVRNRRLNPGYSTYTPQTFMTQLFGRRVRRVSGKSFSNTRDSTFSDAPYVSTPTTLRPMPWATSARCRSARYSPTPTTTVATT